MFNKKLIYTFLIALAGAVSLPSCQDDPLVYPGEEQEETYPGHVLTFTMTLDPMGGSQGRGLESDLSRLENYINLEKVRVFFFDNQERFLFESKSRWVKKLSGTGGHDEWLISVPFYPSGNDKDDYDWPWDSIRNSITNNDFKIAVLVNRPEIECYPDLQNAEEDRLDQNNVSFDNAGPYWNKYDYKKKKMIDLHHCQWDPIYTDKGMRGLGQFPGFYQFVMGEDSTKIGYRNKRMLMSSTSCWVDMGPLHNDKGDKYTAGTSSCRKWKHPSQDYPIPMYGVQNFKKLEHWNPGTPFHLSDIITNSTSDNNGYEHRSISLLRSVVKLELLIDKTVVGNNKNNIQWLGNKYINIYARSEPIDVWTPTEELWTGDDLHSDGSSLFEDMNSGREFCEWELIKQYGPIAHSGDKTGTQSTPNLKEPNAAKKENDNASFIQFRERISWLYGCWSEDGPDKKPRWDFKAHGFTGTFADKIQKNGATVGRGYPHIFNPVTQRNGNVYYDKSMIEDCGTYYYCVVYCGEQNVNDPSDLFCMAGDGTGGSGKSPCPSWVLVYNNVCYNIPIMDHKNGHSHIDYKTGYTTTALPNNNVTYDFHKYVYENYTDIDNMPWPLMRNHVYRIVLGSAGRSGELKVTSSHYTSPTLDFKKSNKNG